MSVCHGRLSAFPLTVLAPFRYFGPCPPTDHDAHTYRFVLAALDTTLDAEAASERPALSEAMAGHAVQRVVLRGRYDR